MSSPIEACHAAIVAGTRRLTRTSVLGLPEHFALVSNVRAAGSPARPCGPRPFWRAWRASCSPRHGQDRSPRRPRWRSSCDRARGRIARRSWSHAAPCELVPSTRRPHAAGWVASLAARWALWPTPCGLATPRCVRSAPGSPGSSAWTLSAISGRVPCRRADPAHQVRGAACEPRRAAARAGPADRFEADRSSFAFPLRLGRGGDDRVEAANRQALADHCHRFDAGAPYGTLALPGHNAASQPRVASLAARQTGNRPTAGRMSMRGRTRRPRWLTPRPEQLHWTRPSIWGDSKGEGSCCWAIPQARWRPDHDWSRVTQARPAALLTTGIVRSEC